MSLMLLQMAKQVVRRQHRCYEGGTPPRSHFFARCLPYLAQRDLRSSTNRLGRDPALIDDVRDGVLPDGSGSVDYDRCVRGAARGPLKMPVRVRMLREASRSMALI